MLKRVSISVFVVWIVLIGAVTTAAGQNETYAPVIDPANFIEGVNHPYFPLTPGTTHVYTGETDEGTERIEVTVLSITKDILGIPCTVVRDTVWLNDDLIEDTFDWYAQDTDGNVWYMGEETREYVNGEVSSTAGAWEAGVDGAQPGIVMQAAPVIGEVYRQEYYVGEAEDMAEVESLDESASTLYGDFDNLLMTRETTPLQPDVAENKYYAEGVGLVLEVKISGGTGRTELVEIVTRDTMLEDDAADATDEPNESDEDDDSVSAPNGTPIITAAQAEEVALAHVGSGTVTEVELEYASTGWVYSVEIDGEEITVDAITGAVLTTEADDD